MKPWRENLRPMTREQMAKLSPKEAIGRLQNLIGHAMSQNHDRNPDKQESVTDLLEEAHTTCIEVRGRWRP